MNGTDSNQGVGAAPAPNTLSIVAQGRLALCDVVFHQDVKSAQNVFPNLLLLLKVLDAQVQDTTAKLSDQPTPMEGAMVRVTVTVEW